ncbi:type VII secretion protein EccB, partial [Mycolicibacter minnesotensis]
FARGNLLGIPGAPERLVQSASTDADWTVCDAVSGSAPGVTLIAGPLYNSGSRAGALDTHHAVLADNGDGAWLLWDGKRSRIDLGDRAVTAALGLDAGASTPRPIAPGLFNVIPEAPALVAPVIPDAGSPLPLALPVPVPIGSVVVAHEIEGNSDAALRYYAVLSD